LALPDLFRDTEKEAGYLTLGFFSFELTLNFVKKEETSIFVLLT